MVYVGISGYSPKGIQLFPLQMARSFGAFPGVQRCPLSTSEYPRRGEEGLPRKVSFVSIWTNVLYCVMMLCYIVLCYIDIIQYDIILYYAVVIHSFMIMIIICSRILCSYYHYHVSSCIYL